jgi:hypothetical protein
MAPADFNVDGSPYMLYLSPREDTDPNMVRIGKLHMTQKAYLVTICGFVAFAFMATMGFGLKGFISATLLLSIYLAYAYSVYCMETGNCQKWSWFLVALIVLKTASLIGLHFAVTMGKPNIRAPSPKFMGNTVTTLF